ncbi:MAG: hypothetical protein R6V83_03650 [Candidatus Thorarchaeota archaeon]
MPNREVEDSNPWWWKPLWIAIPLVAVAFAVLGYLFLQIPLQTAAGALALGLIMIYFAYYIRLHPHKGVNRAVYVTLGACGAFLLVLFGGAFIIGVTGISPPNSRFGLMLMVAPPIIGAAIGDLIGRKRDYRLPLTF